MFQLYVAATCAIPYIASHCVNAGVCICMCSGKFYMNGHIVHKHIHTYHAYVCTNLLMQKFMYIRAAIFHTARRTLATALLLLHSLSVVSRLVECCCCCTLVVMLLQRRKFATKLLLLLLSLLAHLYAAQQIQWEAPFCMQMYLAFHFAFSAPHFAV